MSFWDVLLTVAIIAGKSLFLLSALLIFIAYALYADRKIWAAVQLRPWAQRGRPMGPAAILRRSAEIRAQGADHPGRRQQGAVPARAADLRRRSRSPPGR
jgi:hypothetical protein